MMTHDRDSASGYFYHGTAYLHMMRRHCKYGCPMCRPAFQGMKRERAMRTGKKDVKARYLILVFGAFAVFFTGYPHIWSIYQPYAMELTGWSQGQASMCFYLYFVTFVLGNITGGRIQDRYSPRMAVVIGGGIFTASVLLCSLALVPSPVMMYVFYGIFQGFGQGMIYTTIISTAQKWFPGKTGFASGVIVTANGLFGFFMAPFSRALLAGPGIKAAFLIIGGMIGVSWVLAGIFIKNPEKAAEPEGTVPTAAGREMCAGRKKVGAPKQRASKQYMPKQRVIKQYTSVEMIKTRRFYFLLSTMLFGLIPYLLLSPLSQTIQTDRGISASAAVGAVMAGSVCNAVTRLILPTAADRVGRIICLKAVLAVAASSMVLLVVAPASLTPVWVVLVYACYGGIMGSFPSLTSNIFGLDHSGENYGYVMLGIAAATLGAPAITNAVLGNGYDINVVFAAGAACAVVSFLFLLMLEREMKRDMEPETNPVIRLVN